MSWPWARDCCVAARLAMTVLTGRPSMRSVHRDANLHRRDAAQQIGVGARWRFQHLDHREALEHLFPQDGELELGEPVADTTMNAEAEGEMLAGARTVDQELVGALD